jgi:hypothetical protein
MLDILRNVAADPEERRIIEAEWLALKDEEGYEQALATIATLQNDIAEQGSTIAALQNDKAEQALDYCQKVIPAYTVPYDYTALGIARGYYRIGKPDKALVVCNLIAIRTMKNLRWLQRLNPNQFASAISDLENNLTTMQEVLSLYQQIDPKLMEPYLQDFYAVATRYNQLMQQSRPAAGGLNK